MDIKSLSQVVLKVAPVLGSIIGGPVSSAAISLIASVFGVDPDNIEDLIDKITNDPDKLKQIECLHASSIQSLIFSHLPSKAKINFSLEWEK